jgi:hypothetical protein
MERKKKWNKEKIEKLRYLALSNSPDKLAIIFDESIGNMRATLSRYNIKAKRKPNKERKTPPGLKPSTNRKLLRKTHADNILCKSW